MSKGTLPSAVARMLDDELARCEAEGLADGADLDAMRAMMTLLLTEHPTLGRMTDRLRERPLVEHSGEVVKGEPGEPGDERARSATGSEGDR